MNNLSSASKHSMLVRIISALVMLFVGGPCLLFGGWYYMAAIIIVTLISIYEFVSAPNKGRFNIFIYIVVYVCTLSFVFWHFFASEEMRTSVLNNVFIVDHLSLSPFALIIYFLFLFGTTLFSKQFTMADACYLFSMGVFIGLTMLCILFVRYLPNSTKYYGKEGLASCGLAAYLIIASTMNDIGAYFVGVTCGKHKMAPRISPHKTWEGFFGGFVISFLFSFLFAFLMAYFGFPILPGMLDFSNGINIGWTVMLSLIAPIAGDFGDLVFSSIKRYFGIKDYGTILPGHGGILDRIDGLSFVVLTATLVIVIIQNGWSFLA